jgi:hypothetical protein
MPDRRIGERACRGVNTITPPNSSSPAAGPRSAATWPATTAPAGLSDMANRYSYELTRDNASVGTSVCMMVSHKTPKTSIAMPAQKAASTMSGSGAVRPRANSGSARTG